MNDFLAHSARESTSAQTYKDHIENVVAGALVRINNLLNYFLSKSDGPSKEELRHIIELAAEFHDLGKLDEIFQKKLQSSKRIGDTFRHEDAGVEWLLRRGAIESAGIVSAHHQGLVRYEYVNDNDSITDDEFIDGAYFRINDKLTKERTDSSLLKYIEIHELIRGQRAIIPERQPLPLTSLSRRMLLSCLADSDHHDTAKHYEKEPAEVIILPKWDERLKKLDEYVSHLRASVSEGLTGEEQRRQQLRDELYHICKEADPFLNFRSCDAAVGSGKTTSLMAHLLKVAVDRQLRHIIIVLPYTNIIHQTVEVYRSALCLEGENPENIIAEHHHQVEFDNITSRHMTTLWQAPIIITTAVQFFETLASNKPSKLRKLHQLPGSAICFDEAHAALPIKLWPLCWNWLTELTDDWGCHAVLSSGSLSSFWELKKFRLACEGKHSNQNPKKISTPIYPLVNNETKIELDAAEHQRVRFYSETKNLTPDELIDRIENSPGPRLVVMNTVQSAAMLAKMIQKRCKIQVLHLSTALAPIHRTGIIEKVHRFLKSETKWVLVATSIVESGLNFSFESGFRQRSSMASLIQLGGRVNRNATSGICKILDFDLEKTPHFPDNPFLRMSKIVLKEMFERELIHSDEPTDFSRLCLKAIESEFTIGAQKEAVEKIKLEYLRDYPSVSKECRVIEADDRLVVIDQELIKRLKKREKVLSHELIQKTVRIHHSKINKLDIPRIFEGSEIYGLPVSWSYDSDFLGYMAEIVNNTEYSIEDGYFI